MSKSKQEIRRLVSTISIVGLGKALKQLMIREEKSLWWKTLNFWNGA